MASPRPSTPRIRPRPESDWDDDDRALLARAMGSPDQTPLNIFLTLVNHPRMLKYWMVFAAGILNKGALPPRDREILILRVVVGMSAEETAEAVGSTPGAVRVAQHRALAKLKAEITATEHGHA